MLHYSLASVTTVDAWAVACDDIGEFCDLFLPRVPKGLLLAYLLDHLRMNTFELLISINIMLKLALQFDGVLRLRNK